MPAADEHKQTQTKNALIAGQPMDVREEEVLPVVRLRLERARLIHEDHRLHYVLRRSGELRLRVVEHFQYALGRAFVLRFPDIELGGRALIARDESIGF